MLRQSEHPLCFIASSEGAAEKIAEATGALFPDIDILVLPPWDCLPYDRVAPTRHCMGLRMDALRLWNSPSEAPRLLVTSLDAMLQRVPPIAVITESRLDLAVGAPFDRDAFFAFAARTGYVQEAVADDPGEMAAREGVIDIYPGGAPGPMRIVLSEKGRVLELRGFDRLTQRTESYLDSVTIGPASEAILTESPTSDQAVPLDTMERLLLRLYDDMPSAFECLGEADLVLAPGTADRVERSLEIIEDARRAREDFGDAKATTSRSFYLDRDEWDRYAGKFAGDRLDLTEGGDVPTDPSDANGRRALLNFIEERNREGLKILLCGTGRPAETLARRLAKITGLAPVAIDDWRAALKAAPGTLMTSACQLAQDFYDARANIVVIAVTGDTGMVRDPGAFLSEPELRIGDVVVHEDHGIGVLKDLEGIAVEGVDRDAARLQYRDGSSILVPMEEFGKLWRYGSEPEAVTLDRLHTDAWQKKQDKIAGDIQSTARHLLKVAKRRQTSQAPTFVPPRAEFLAFMRGFPFAETPDQAEAIRAVMSDLASGRPMNRLICGDVGFGKTEIALRAAAAVALAGGQVAVIAPTTVLARQHFASFQRRFAKTGIAVGMLSRLLKPREATQVKMALAKGEIGVIIATQAILAKDVRFAELALLIVDEEHRFGLKEKRAMTALAPSLHTLVMSATPIPRTLQSAMVGVQDVSLLTTPPYKRRPVRTSLAAFDNASMRTGLMREFRRSGQSFVVVPRIEDIEAVEAILSKIVPELSVKVAHGKMPAAAIDSAIVGFAEGDGDVLLATNIIENGIDVPRANTIFVWHAERFGLAQLHQLRGRVGRAGAQGMAYLLTEPGADLAEETRLRLESIVENDRLGAGLSLSLRDLDLRGGGDIAGEDQAGHMKAIGVGLYQKLLAGAVAKLRRQPSATARRAVLNLGLSAIIPSDYVPDAAVRLNLYAKLLRASTRGEMDDLEEEFEDRFGEPPREVLLLLRATRLQIAAGQLGISKLEAGPKALALTLSDITPAKHVSAWTKKANGARRDERLIFETAGETSEDYLKFFERIVRLRAG
ncbi:DEAD/DEAH box helicase [Neorhizobium sp. NPDC001467]|uniref:DEAD/DEAH box helicase n=1 Tax=Neorhizobium sp. NPDC001467 TaxID=3390595 RepID=UPI003D069BB0